VTTILLVRSEALIVKLCSADAVPEHDAKALNVPVVVIVGAFTITKVKLLLELRHPVVLFLTFATKLYVLAALAGIVILIGEAGRLSLVTGLKLDITVGAPVVIENWSGLFVMAVYGKLKLVAVLLTPVTEPKVIVGKSLITTDIALPVLEHPVIEFVTLNVPVYVPAPGFEGAVMAIGEEGKLALLTFVNPPIIAPADQEILY